MKTRKNYNRFIKPAEWIDYKGLRFFKRGSGHYHRLPDRMDQFYKGKFIRRPFSLHVAIWEHLNAKTLPNGYCIHHIDLKADNNPLDGSNYQLMTIMDHNLLHRLIRSKKKYDSQRWLFDWEDITHPMWKKFKSLGLVIA